VSRNAFFVVRNNQGVIAAQYVGHAQAEDGTGTELLSIVSRFQNGEIGATWPQLLFADQSIVIFYSYPAMIMYSLEKREIIDALDLPLLRYDAD
jgi:hypothetical protein